MKYHLPSISSFERVQACAASEVLPIRVVETGEYAERGTVGHWFSDVVVTGSMAREEALARIANQEWKDWLALAKLEPMRAFFDHTPKTEVTFAIDIDSEIARTLGHHLGRNYSAAMDCEVVGTTDYLGSHLGIPAILDLKTGQRVTEAKDNYQIKFAAYAVQQLTGAEVVYGGLVYLDELGELAFDVHLFTHEELAGLCGDFESATRRVLSAFAAYEEDGRVELHPGSYCTYCPAVSHCPAKTAVIRSIVPDLDMMTSSVSALTPEQQAYAWSKVKLFKPILEKIEDDLKLIVKAKGIDLPDGRKVRAVEVQKPNAVTVGRLIDELRKRGMTDEEFEAMKTPRVETHCKTLGPKPKPSGVVVAQLPRGKRSKKVA